LRLNEEVMPNLNLTESRYPLLDCHKIPRDENAFVDWLVDAKPGETLAYYRGHLAVDRDSKQSRLGDSKRRKLSHLAGRVMESCEKKHVLIVQRRMGQNDSIYLAIRTDEPLLPARARPSSTPEVRSMHHA
jgi:hypothetical protein